MCDYICWFIFFLFTKFYPVSRRFGSLTKLFTNKFSVVFFLHLIGRSDDFTQLKKIENLKLSTNHQKYFKVSYNFMEIFNNCEQNEHTKLNTPGSQRPKPL